MAHPLLPYALACQQTYVGRTPTFEDNVRLTHVYVSQVEGRICFAFEGTQSPDEWMQRDFDVFGRSAIKHPEFGPLHNGLARGALGVCDAIEGYLTAGGWPAYVLTGHSKGVECWIAAAELKRRGHAPAFVAAFEGPHVGTRQFSEYCRDIPGAETCTVNSHGRDIVTMVPWAVPGMEWSSVKSPRLELRVPDSYDIAAKHRIPAVIEALTALPDTPRVGAW